MTGFRVARKVGRAVAISALLLAGCSSAPEMPPGAISSEQAQKLILERDDARDAAAARERELLAEIERLKAEIREVRSTLTPSDPAPTAARPDVAAPPRAPEADLAVEMTNLSSIPIETNSSWTRFSWQAVVHNNLERPISVNAVVVFQDASGFELEAIDNRITLQPLEYRTIKGVKLIDVQVAGRVTTVSGRVGLN